MSMATIKADTRLKDAIKKREAARLVKRAVETQALRNLVTNIPAVDPAVVPQAVDALMDAADQYKASQPLVDHKGRHSKTSISAARTSVAAFSKHLCKAKDQLSNLPLDAIAAIGQATDASVGKMKSDVEQVLHVAQRALVALTHPQASSRSRVPSTRTSRSTIPYP
jgi:hypothetical protein